MDAVNTSAKNIAAHWKREAERQMELTMAAHANESLGQLANLEVRSLVHVGHSG